VQIVKENKKQKDFGRLVSANKPASASYELALLALCSFQTMSGVLKFSASPG
jgi:hypothetical protein